MKSIKSMMKKWAAEAWAEVLAQVEIQTEIVFDDDVRPIIEMLLPASKVPPWMRVFVIEMLRRAWDAALDEHIIHFGPVSVRMETGDGHGV